MELVAKLPPLEGLNTERNKRMVAYWLLAGVIMVIIQIAIGGITRLTGSGLSITEWDVVTGFLPPFNEAGWMTEFDKYKTTPQFELLNNDFSLADFKFIFFWEWFHRLWARILGLVFAAGFIYFLATRKFEKPMIKPLVVLFLLGGVQGAIGWIMVASGLVGDAVYVKPTRLALHFIFAMGLLSYTFWFYLKLRIAPTERLKSPKIKAVLLAFMGLLIIQLLYGALMAGHKAASAAPTWPSINGSLLSPAGLYKSDHGILNFIDNKIMVHYVHRGLAYVFLVFSLFLSFRIRKAAPAGSLLQKCWYLPIVFIGVQVWLGILTVLNSKQIIPNGWGPFEWMAQLHQFTGMALLLLLVFLYFLSNGKRQTALKAV